MLSIQECKKHLGNLDLSDKEVEELRNSMYLVIGGILDDYYKNNYETNNKTRRI